MELLSLETYICVHYVTNKIFMYEEGMYFIFSAIFSKFYNICSNPSQ